MLQTIDPFQLPSLPLSETANLPEVPSVYFVLDGDEIVYIGRSSNLRRRWNLSYSHHALPRLLGRTRLKISWLTCSDEKLVDEIEGALINYFNPPLNRTKGFRSSKDTVQIAVILKKDLKGILQHYAEVHHWSMSQAAALLIERGLGQWIESKEDKKVLEEQSPKKQ